MTNTISDQNWHAIIEPLLSSAGVDYSIEVNDDSISIFTNTADVDRIRSTLEKSLHSRQDLSEALSYTITPREEKIPVVSQATIEKQSSATASKIPYPNLEDTPQEGLEVLKRFVPLLDKKTGLNLELIFDLSNIDTISKNYILFSPYEDDDAYEAIYQGIEKLILPRFQGVKKSDLIDIWQDPNKYLPNGRMKLGEDETIAGLVAKCFGVDAKGKQSRLFFDYGLLRDLIFPINLAVQAQEGSDISRIVIKKSHLRTKLGQLNSQGSDDSLFFRVYKKGNQVIGQPLVLTGYERIPKPRRYVFILDASLSMGERGQVSYVKRRMNGEAGEQGLIDKLAERDSNSQIRIIIFSDSYIQADFDLSAQGVRSAKGYIERQYYTRGDTALRNTVYDSIKTIEEDKSERYQTVVMLISDGEDTASKRISADDLFSLKTKKLKAFFACGVGQQYDSGTLEKFSLQYKTPFIHLNSMADFSGLILGYVEKHLQYNKKPVTITINDESWAVELPQDGNLHVLRTVTPAFSPTTTISYGGKHFILSLNDPSKIQSATVSDLLNEIQAGVDAILADEQKTLSQKKVVLDNFIYDLQKLSGKKGLKYQIKEIDKTREKIQAYHDEIDRGIKDGNDLRHASLRSQARDRLNYIKATDKVEVSAQTGAEVNDPNYYASSSAGRKLLSFPEADLSSLQTSAAEKRINNPISSLLGLFKQGLAWVTGQNNDLPKVLPSASASANTVSSTAIAMCDVTTGTQKALKRVKKNKNNHGERGQVLNVAAVNSTDGYPVEWWNNRYTNSQHPLFSASQSGTSVLLPGPVHYSMNPSASLLQLTMK